MMLNIHKYPMGKVECYSAPTIIDKIKNYFKRRQKAGIPGMKWGTSRQKTKGADIMSNTMFKVGDKVRVKEGLKGGEYYGGLYFNHAMADRCGKVATITKAFDGDEYSRYELDIESMDFVYNDDMLEPYSGFSKSDLKDGMVVQHRDGEMLIVFGDTLVAQNGTWGLDEYHDDLTDCNKKDADIVKVYKVKPDCVNDIHDVYDVDYLDLIWERKEEPTRKYKPGDRVKVRSDLECITKYGTHHFVHSMKPLLGKTVTIIGCGPYCDDYRIKELDGYLWTNDMFEGLVVYEEMTVAEIEKKLGHKVKIVDGE